MQRSSFSAAASAAVVRVVTDAYKATLLWWAIQREASAGIGYAELLPSPKPYVGLHTPDSDPAARWRESNGAWKL